MVYIKLIVSFDLFITTIKFLLYLILQISLHPEIYEAVNIHEHVWFNEWCSYDELLVTRLHNSPVPPSEHFGSLQSLLA
jgi:hypothetical protein